MRYIAVCTHKIASQCLPPRSAIKRYEHKRVFGLTQKWSAISSQRSNITLQLETTFLSSHVFDEFIPL